MEGLTEGTVDGKAGRADEGENPREVEAHSP